MNKKKHSTWQLSPIKVLELKNTMTALKYRIKTFKSMANQAEELIIPEAVIGNYIFCLEKK